MNFPLMHLILMYPTIFLLVIIPTKQKQSKCQSRSLAHCPSLSHAKPKHISSQSFPCHISYAKLMFSTKLPLYVTNFSTVMRPVVLTPLWIPLSSISLFPRFILSTLAFLLLSTTPPHQPWKLPLSLSLSTVFPYLSSILRNLNLHQDSIYIKISSLFTLKKSSFFHSQKNPHHKRLPFP